MQINVVSVSWFSPLRHYGLMVTYPNGAVVAYANAPKQGVVRQSLAEFAAGRQVRAEALPSGADQDPRRIVARAERMLGMPYALTSFNCDHFVAAALGMKPESKQLQTVGWLAGLALMVRLAG